MKRFLGYILLCVSVLISVFAGFVPTILSINASADYDNGQNFVYKIETKEGSTKNDGDIESGAALLSISDLFKTRLDAANISTYKLETEGTDTIRLSFKAQNEINTAVSSFLNFDWGIQAMDYTGKIFLDSDDFFKAGTAYIDYTSSYPVIVMPLANAEDFKTKLYENVNGTKTDSDASTSSFVTFADEEGTTETKNENYIYLVNNWDTSSYSMEKVITTSDTADTDETDAYINRIDATKPENVYFDYDATKKDTTFKELLYTGFLSKAGTDLSLANKLANIALNEINGTKLDYKVTLINKDVINQPSNNTNPFIENLISHGSEYGSFKSIVFSTLLISLLIAFVIVSLFMILNYGLSALSSIALTPSILLLTLAIFNSFGAEFNIGTIVALIGVAIISLFSSLSYFKAVKEELYKGRNLKKANQEASKKSAGIQIDLSIISILVGLVAYLIPDSVMVSVGAILILGGLFNLIFNGIFLRGIYYFLTNSSFIEGHLNLLMIEKKKIPDLSKDEKPTYFEPFKKGEKKKKNRIFAIGGAILLLASIIGMASFQFANGNIYNSDNSSVKSSRIYIQFDYNENSSIQSVSDLESKVLDNLYTYDTTSNTTTKNKVGYKDVLNYTYSYKENYANNKETLKTIYYIIELNNVYTVDSKVSAYVDETYNLENANIEDAIQYLVRTYNSASNLTSVNLKGVVNVNNDSNNYYCLLFVVIGSAIAGLYLILRFGLSRGLASFLLVVAANTITVGIFSLVRGPFSSQITLGVILLTILGFGILDSIFVKERNIRKDSHIDNNDLAARKENSLYALNLVYSNLVIIVALAVFIIISFLFASTFSTYFIVFGVLGTLIIMIFYKFISTDLIYALSTLFTNVGRGISSGYNTHREKRNKKKNITDKGDGPEEATFIGIND